MKIVSVFQTKIRAATSAIVLAVVLVAGFSVGPSATVSADGWDEMTSNCHLMKPEGNQLHQVGYALYSWNTGEVYGWTKHLFVPSNSACEDINLGALKVWRNGSLSSVPSDCADFRVHFYPSSGGDSYSSWKRRCPGDGAAPIASNVRNGTEYRIEFKEAINYNDSYYFYIWD